MRAVMFVCGEARLRAHWAGAGWVGAGAGGTTVASGCGKRVGGGRRSPCCGSGPGRCSAAAGCFRHLPLTGRMLQVGAGTGHVGEAVLRRMQSRQCVVADAVQCAAAAVGPAHAGAGLHRDPRGAGCAAIRGRAVRCGLGQLHAATPVASAAQERAVAEMARVVRPGGTLILVEDVLRDGARGPVLAWARHFRPAEEWRQRAAAAWVGGAGGDCRCHLAAPAGAAALAAAARVRSPALAFFSPSP